jgi:cellulose biosynthesis protein BcsQ
MKTYAFWNNKGGTGKTSLAFQTCCMYAEEHSDQRILALDLCPQANLSELFLGGLLGNGSRNLMDIQNQDIRQSVGGYFQERLPSPFVMPDNINPHSFLCTPSKYNTNIPENIVLLAGDAIVELQLNAISSLANTQVPGTNTWLQIIDWLRDFMVPLQDEFDFGFIDANPSFSLSTQIALAASDRVILPVMADDSSRRAIQNAFGLVHGLNLPSEIYRQHNFHARLQEAGRIAPLFHLFPKNRITQYMGPASAFATVLSEIDSIINDIMYTNPGIFSFTNISDGIVDIRDFGTTGVVAFAFGKPFSTLNSGSYDMSGQRVQIRSDYLNNCIRAIEFIVEKIN